MAVNVVKTFTNPAAKTVELEVRVAEIEGADAYGKPLTRYYVYRYYTETGQVRAGKLFANHNEAGITYAALPYGTLQRATAAARQIAQDLWGQRQQSSNPHDDSPEEQAEIARIMQEMRARENA